MITADVTTLHAARVDTTLLAQGVTPLASYEQLQITTPTVFKWRKRYLEAGIEGLSNLSRSGQPLELGAEKIKEILP